MSFSAKNSMQFIINELVLVTKAGPIDIANIYEEINIFDSLFTPVMSGNILIRDSIGLSGKLLFDGSESILFDITKSGGSDIASFHKSFRVYKQSDRKAQNLSSELFVLNFVSDELIFSDQQRITQSFEGTYSKAVEKILVNYLKVPDNQTRGIFEPTTGIRSFVFPNLKPFDAIEWCTKRAVDQNQAPNYMFFQNNIGYNFVSLSKLLVQEDILNIKFELKNTSESNALTEMTSARALEVVEQTDMIEKTRSGVNAGQFIGFDPITRTTAKKRIGFADVFKTMKHANENPNQSVIINRAGIAATEAYAAKKSMSFMDTAKQLSKYIKDKDPTSISKIDNIENWLFQRKAIINLLMSKRIKLAMPGNFQLTSGFNINLDAPNFGKKAKGDDNNDPSLSGKYIIIASRHILGIDKHETIIECGTTSTNNEFIPVSNPEQTEALIGY